MSRFQLIAFLCLVLFLIGARQTLAAKTKGETVDTSVSSILPDAKSGTALVDQLMRHVNDIGNYKYDAFQEAHLGSKVVQATGTFYFRPASSVRMEVKDYGCKSGSILVKSPDGKLIGKGGPAMWGMKMTLGSDSRLLRMPNGLSALDCDLATLLGRLRKAEASGCKIVSGAGPIKVESLGIPVIVIESQKDGESGPAILDRVFIDPAQKLPLQWDLFEKGNLQSRSKFQNYQINAHWDDSQFKL
jgi:outer membrane lipoprotein-sorting protein